MKNKERAIWLDETTLDIIVGLHVFFSDYEKMMAWLTVDNLNLGGCSAIDLINRGRGKRVQEFINNALESNRQIDGVHSKPGEE